jgi:hypothetical protein
MSKKRDALFARIRTLCLSFPEASERESHGNPTFFVREKRSFLNLIASYYYVPGDRPAIICAAPEGVQAALVDEDPELYFVPKYVAKLGWIGMWLDRDAKWDTIASVVGAAYETSAEKIASKKRATKQKATKKT